jgi:hypothetical protein
VKQLQKLLEQIRPAGMVHTPVIALYSVFMKTELTYGNHMLEDAFDIP